IGIDSKAVQRIVLIVDLAVLAPVHPAPVGLPLGYRSGTQLDFGRELWRHASDEHRRRFQLLDGDERFAVGCDRDGVVLVQVVGDVLQGSRRVWLKFDLRTQVHFASPDLQEKTARIRQPCYAINEKGIGERLYQRTVRGKDQHGTEAVFGELILGRGNKFSVRRPGQK